MGSVRGFAMVACALLAGCAATATTAAPGRSAEEVALARVAAIHGGAGPFAVAGYRMGERALSEFSIQRGSFDVEVEHTSPAEVQYSCIADGVAASTGASVGRLNLRRVDATDGATRTQVRDRRSGRTLVLRLTEGFLARFRDVPMPGLGAAGRTVLGLRDEEIFEVVSDRGRESP
ncbi:MAG: hypothetical protein EPO40_11455 [Myxococcaceae bacterium]|nr:MAG: hypothetical protein EPO40_11455 [Myxococcaceae bacterium]